MNFLMKFINSINGVFGIEGQDVLLTRRKVGIKKEVFWNPLASHRQDYRNPMAKAVLNSIQNNIAVVS